MQPDAQQSPPPAPAGLPPVAPMPQPAANQGVPVPAAAPVPMAQASMAAAAQQAKRLVAQYRQDPYRLSEALGALKASAQAAQYNIMPDQGEK